MLDSIFTASFGDTTLPEILLCTAVSLILGALIACVYMYRNAFTKQFVVTIALMPALIQSVIMVVNGNLGTGVAVMGAFSLVRFRSAPGSAKEIASIFFAMAVGLAAGMGYLLYAAVFTAIISIMMLLYARLRFGERDSATKTLRVTIPEDLDYTTAFDDLLAQYASTHTLDRVRTTNLGGLFELQYTVSLRDIKQEKELLDQIRQRNGNLGIICSRLIAAKDEL